MFIVSYHFTVLYTLEVSVTVLSVNRFFYKVQPYVQSLPELIHHKDLLTDSLLEQVNECSVDVLNSFVRLIPPLARYWYWSSLEIKFVFV